MPSTDYPAGHWLLSEDPERVLAASRRQQALAYSRVKNAFLFELMGDLAGRRVLDVGCGAGWMSVAAARRGARLVLGLDVLPTALGAARLLARREGLSEGCAFVQAADLASIAPGFDIILLRDVVEHLPDDEGFLSAVASRLAPGGRVVLSTQNSRSLNYFLEGGCRRILLGQTNWLGWDPTHLRFYTPDSLARTMARAGLRATDWRSAYLLPHKVPAPRWSSRQYLRLESLVGLDRWLGRSPPFNRLGYSLMVRGEPT